MERSILFEKYIFPPKMVLWKHADSQEFNSFVEYETKIFWTSSNGSEGTV